MRIVLISLERATERRRRMAAEFARVGLEYEVWPAKDAGTLTDEDRRFVDRARRRRLGLYPIPDGSLANTLSQRAAMRDLVRNGPEMMAVFEDDARFDTDLPAVLRALEQRSDTFDIVKLQRRNVRRPFVPTIPLTTGHWLGRVRFSDFGSEGYVITREAARLLLERTPRMVREIDHVLSRFWESGLNVLYVDPPVVREDGADSQIQETRSMERLLHRRERWRRPAMRGVEISTRKVAMCARHGLGELFKVLASGKGRGLVHALEELVDYLASNAKRAHPKRDRKTGRLQFGLEPVLGGA